MAIAFVTTIPELHLPTLNLVLMAIAILVGIPVAAVAARAVKITAIPQMVASLTGLAGERRHWSRSMSI